MASSLLNYNLNLEVGNTYTFNTIAPAILQATYTNAVLIAKGGYSDVTRILNAISTLGYTNINSNVTNYVSSASSATTTTTSSTQSAST